MIGQLIAYRLWHFGYAPLNSYKYFLSIILSIFIIFVLTKILVKNKILLDEDNNFFPNIWSENFRINDIAKKLKLLGVKLNVVYCKPNYPDGVISDKFKSFFPIEHNFKGLIF